LIVKSQNMAWYEGPSVIEFLDALEINRNLEDPLLRMSISRVHKIPLVGIVAEGKIYSGTLI
jgi:translation elongation factor EF-1alpha